MNKTLLQQALDALESLFSGKVEHDRGVKCSNAIIALREAIAQPVQQKPTLAESAQWAEEVLTDTDIHGIARRCDASINDDLRYLWLARAVLVQAGLKLPHVAQPVQPAVCDACGYAQGTAGVSCGTCQPEQPALQPLTEGMLTKFFEAFAHKPETTGFSSFNWFVAGATIAECALAAHIKAKDTE